MDGGHLKNFITVHNHTVLITYKNKSWLWNDMFSTSHLSTEVPLNQYLRIIVIPHQENKMWLLLHKNEGRSRVV